MRKFIRAGSVLFASMLATNAVALQVGDRAADFVAMSTIGELTLSQIAQKGPVVLALYPADFTPG